MVEEGALPHEIDAVLKDFGMPMGTFEVRDLSGTENVWVYAFRYSSRTKL